MIGIICFLKLIILWLCVCNMFFLLIIVVLMIEEIGMVKVFFFNLISRIEIMDKVSGSWMLNREFWFFVDFILIELFRDFSLFFIILSLILWLEILEIWLVVENSGVNINL